MNPTTGQVITAMLDYNHDSPELCNHALKVFGYAKGIGETEGLPAEVQQSLEVAAVLHDIGIRISEVKYHSFSGKYQQIEGPSIARAMLEQLHFAPSLIERVCYLIAHHHEYDHIDGLDYQILVEADFLVNLYEEGASQEAIEHARDTIFRTATGRAYLENLFCKPYAGPNLFRDQILECAGYYGKFHK